MKKPVKVLFVVLPYLIDYNKVEHKKTAKLRSFISLPYGVLSISSYCKKELGDEIVNFKIFDCNAYYNYEEDLKNLVENNDYDIVGLSLMFDNSYQYLHSIVNIIHDYSDAFLFLGGIATKTSYFDILRDYKKQIDGICYGEGELPFKNLISIIYTHDNIGVYQYLKNNSSWITKDTLSKKEVEELQIENLDEIIDLDYSLLDNMSVYNSMEEAFSPFIKKDSNRKQFFMVTTRGCRFSCVFCMSSKSKNKKVRYASVDKIVDHVEYLINEYGMNVLTFYDDQILYYKDRAKELFKRLAKYNLRIEMPNGVSVMYIDEELADLMWSAGVDTLYLAIESGSDYLIKNVIHKPVNLKKAKDIINMLRKHNFWLLGYFVTGLPEETNEHRKETIDYIKDVGFDWISFSLASPVRGSLLYDQCIENGYIDSDLKIGTFDMTKYQINNGIYTPEEITTINYRMNLDINFYNNYREKVGDLDTAEWCYRFVIDKYPDHAMAYYCLARVLNTKLQYDEANRYVSIANNICNNDKVWEEHFKHFKII